MLIADRVGAFIERERLLAPGDRVVAGVSGGADSLCLLDCLERLGYRVLVAHLDHGWRPRSWRDAAFVLRTARDRQLPAIIERVPPPGVLAGGQSLEEAGRLARYRFLARTARDWGARLIATGHTADDQAETILMHLLRGAGVHGLRGMLPRTALEDWAAVAEGGGLSLVRPLLETLRSETEAHCRAAGLRPRLDETNRDPAHFRNRLRHDLLPILARYNPRVREVLRRTGAVMRWEAELLDEVLASVEPAVVVPRGGEAVAIRRDAFLAQLPALQAELVARAARRVAPGLRDFGYEAIDLARARIGHPSPARRTSLPGGLELLDQGSEVLLLRTGADPGYPELPQLVSDAVSRITLPARVPLMDGQMEFTLDRHPPRRPARPAAGRWEPVVWLDAARLAPELTVRTPRPGDRMRPLGMDGHRKLADIFNSLHIPSAARRRWPVVLSGDAIVCLAGLRLAQEARLTARSRLAVRLRIELAERPAV